MTRKGKPLSKIKTILIVNDDGIDNKKIFKLKNVLENYGEVFICVPNEEKSGFSHATFKYQINAENIWKKDEYENTFIHNKSPSDGIKFFLKFIRSDVDLVVSGVNEGYNLGIDTLYSGTIGAALEANIHNIKSIALSAKKGSNDYWDKLKIVFDRFILNDDWGGASCLNINFPERFTDKDNLFKIVPLAIGITSTNIDTDYTSCRYGGYITITPLKLDLTDYVSLIKLEIGGNNNENKNN